MNLKKILLFFALSAAVSISFAQDTIEGSLVKWYDVQTATELCQKNPKPLLVDVYTEWCGWCKYMMKTTYANPNLASYINTYFYPVRLDAETKDTLVFFGKKYAAKGKYNTLATELTNGRMSFPTTVFISRDKQKFAIPGYLKISQIEPFLVYFAEDLVNSVNINDFTTAYKMAYPEKYKEDLSKIDTKKLPDTTGQTNWLSFEQAFEKAKTQKRKYLIFGNVDWCYSCKIMKKITFSNHIIADKINKNFYAIDFNAATQDTITIDGKKFVSLGKGQPHQLAMELYQRQFFFPSVIILDEDFKELTVIRAYLTPEQLEPILDYFNSDSYKNQDFDTFMKTFKSSLNSTQ